MWELTDVKIPITYVLHLEVMYVNKQIYRLRCKLVLFRKFQRSIAEKIVCNQ